MKRDIFFYLLNLNLKDETFQMYELWN